MKTEIYKGHVITFKCGFYGTLGKFFKTVMAAKKAIDKELQ